MKIALCVSSLPLCGVGTSVGIIRLGLLNAGHAVDVLVTSHYPGSDFERAREDGWSIECCCEGVRFLKTRLKATLERLTHYDVVINNQSMEAQLVAPCLSNHIIRLSVLRGLNARAVEQISLNSRDFDAAVAVSQEMLRFMQQTSSIRCPVHLIPNCTEAGCDTLVELDSSVRIAYVGWLRQADKNTLVLPEIVACLQRRNLEFHLTVVGDGPDRRLLEQRLDVTGCNSRVTLCGQLPRGEAQDVLRHSHFTLIPSHYEGLSNVMLEAMATGSVPVASDLENFKWVLGDAAPELQAPVDCADQYAERIAVLAGNPSEYRRIQVYLRDRQQKMFTPETTVNGYLDLLTQLRAAHDPGNFTPVPFGRLSLPGRYRRQCTVWWRCLQKAKDVLGRSLRVI